MKCPWNEIQASQKRACFGCHAQNAWQRKTIYVWIYDMYMYAYTDTRQKHNRGCSTGVSMITPSSKPQHRFRHRHKWGMSMKPHHSCGCMSYNGAPENLEDCQEFAVIAHNNGPTPLWETAVSLSAVQNGGKPRTNVRACTYSNAKFQIWHTAKKEWCNIMVPQSLIAWKFESLNFEKCLFGKFESLKVWNVWKFEKLKVWKFENLKI